MKVETTIKDALVVEMELQELLRTKATMKLKFGLTELLLKIQTRTTPARTIIGEFFKNQTNNHIKVDGNGNVMIQRFKTKDIAAPPDAPEEETDEWKQFNELNAQKIEFEHEGIERNLFEQLDTNVSCVSLIDLLIKNNLLK